MQVANISNGAFQDSQFLPTLARKLPHLQALMEN